jgi:hypothetical protein
MRVFDKEQHAAHLEYFKNESASQVASRISQHKRVMGLTMGQFSLIDLIHEILKKVGPSDVIIATWSAGIKDIRTIEWMKDTSLLRSFNFIVDHSYVTRKAQYVLEIQDIVGIENIFTSEIHAKFVLIAAADTKITIRTSMNLNANKTCETFEMDQDDEIYAFYHGFASEIMGVSTPGFLKDSSIASENLSRAFNKKVSPFKWQENVLSIQFQ